jgi:N-acetyl-beta-hexosaminidase
MGDRERGGLGRSTAQGSCDPSLGRALQTQRGERRQGGSSSQALTITAASSVGLFYGAQTVKQLVE